MIIWNSDQQLTANFKMSEFYSKSSDAPYAHELRDELVTAAQIIRDWAGVPVRITSSYRTESHNNSLPFAVSTSRHLVGKAIDLQFVVDNSYWINEMHNQIKFDGELFDELREVGITCYGMYDTFAHIDVRDTKPNGSTIGEGEMYTFNSMTSTDGVGEDGAGAVVKGNIKNLGLLAVAGLLIGSRWM